MKTGIGVSVLLGAVAWVAQDAQPEKAGLPKVGDVAPTFRLNDHDGDGVSVGGPADWWTVLAWYPKARTPG